MVTVESIEGLLGQHLCALEVNLSPGGGVSGELRHLLQDLGPSPALGISMGALGSSASKAVVLHLGSGYLIICCDGLGQGHETAEKRRESLKERGSCQ